MRAASRGHRADADRPAPRPADRARPRSLPGRGDLEFHYTGLSFIDPDRVYFKLQTRGLRQGMDRRRNAPHRLLHEHPPGPVHVPRPGLQQRRHLERDRATRRSFACARIFARRPGSTVCAPWRLALSGYGVLRLRAARARAREGELERAGGRAHDPARGGSTQAPEPLRARRAHGHRQPPPLRSNAGARVEARVRDGLPLSLIMIDIDYFKDFNDANGHQVGDQCLRRVAARDPRSALTRPGDLLARYGGEEFAAILPSTPLRGAVAVAEVLRARVESMATRHPKAPKGVVTISLGVATASPGAGSSPEARRRGGRGPLPGQAGGQEPGRERAGQGCPGRPGIDRRLTDPSASDI